MIDIDELYNFAVHQIEILWWLQFEKYNLKI